MDQLSNSESLLTPVLSTLSHPRIDPDAPIRFTCVMKLADKYLADVVRNRIKGILEDSWPVVRALAAPQF